MAHLFFTVQIIGMHPKILKELNHEITDCWVYYIMYNLKLTMGWSMRCCFFEMAPSVNQKVTLQTARK